LNVRILNRTALKSLLNMSDCIELMREAFVLVSDHAALQPIRRSLPLPNGRGLVSMMPGHISRPACFGVKVVSVYPGNHGTDFGSHQGAVLLFDDKTGALKSILDGREVTAIRTAAASAAATDALARRDCRTLTIYGYGDEAATHLESLTLVRQFERILICGRSAKKAEEFARAMADHIGRPLEHTDDFEAAAHADVIATVTSAKEPFLQGRWLRPGTHINVVGSSIATAAEVDDEVVLRSRFFTDYTASALELGAELRRAIDRGVISASHIVGCVGDVLSGKVAGRRDDAEITCFKSLGMVAEDLITASFVTAAAEKTQIGVTLDW